MKITAHDTLRILRLYTIAGEQHTPKDIKRLHTTNPVPSNTLVSFVFDGVNYAILFDESLDDSRQKITDQIAIVHPGREVTLHENTRSDTKTYAMPYQGKECYLVSLNTHTTRLDIYLARTRPEFSRATWQHFIKAGHVSVDGHSVTRPKTPITTTSDVTVQLPELENHDQQQLPIIYIDDDIVVIDKPAGVLTHAKNERDNEFTVEAFMKRHIDDSLGPDDRHGIVHRLDRDTSGLIVGARTRTSYHRLKEQFAHRQVKKVYHAIVNGRPDAPKATIDVPVARSNSAPGTFVPSVNGKSAETYYEVLKPSGSRSLIKLMPKTGRTHQLRVHMAYLNTPILGDQLYGERPQADQRMYLHASEIGFADAGGQLQTFTSPIPSSFAAALEVPRNE